MEDWFARPPKNLISPSELGSEGKGQALVLRYGGCQMRELQCPLCYAWRYAWRAQNGHKYDIEKVFSSLRKVPTLAKKKIVWIRIQGGEPLLTYDRAITTIKYAGEAVDIVHSSGINYYPLTRAVIQTNGIIFNKFDETQLSNFRSSLKEVAARIATRGRIIFEISFKSSNNLSVLNQQVNGYEAILKKVMIPLWEEGTDNLAIYPIAGLGPSIDLHNVWLIPIEPTVQSEIPLFHASLWSELFRNLVTDFFENIVSRYNAYYNFRENPKTNGGTRLAIEELEPAKFQSAWIKRYAEQNTTPPINLLLRRTSDEPDPQWMSNCLFGKNQKWRQVVENIPLALNPEQLIDSVKSMGEYFYPSHPKGHYPYL